MFSVKNFIFPILLIPLVISGCGSSAFEFLDNKNSPEANRESVRMLIDDQQYDEAVSVMEGQCGISGSGPIECANDDDAQLMAAAYMGAAGLDVLDFIKNAEDVAAVGGDGSDFQSMAFLFPPYDADTGKGGLTLNDNFTKIDKAVQVLCNITGVANCGDISGLTDDQSLQLTMAQAAAGVIAMGVDPTNQNVATAGGYNTTSGSPVSCGASCNAVETGLIMLSSNVPSSNAFDVSATSGAVGAYVAKTLITSALSVGSIGGFVDAEVAQMISDLVATIDNIDINNLDCEATGTQVTEQNLGDFDITNEELEIYMEQCLQLQ